MGSSVSNSPLPITANTDATFVSVQGTVEFSRGTSGVWQPATTNVTLHAGDSLRTAEFSRATLRLGPQSILQVSELTSIRIRPRQESLLLQLFRGLLYFFHRDGSTPLEVEGAGINAAVLGTDVAIGITPEGQANVTLYDGRVDLRTAHGQASLQSGQRAVVLPGQAPTTAPLVAGDFSAIQWFLHYPAILVPEDLGWHEPTNPALAKSLRLYRAGSFREAFDAVPQGHTPSSPEEQVYLAALSLAIGQVPAAEQWLAQVPTVGVPGRLAHNHQQWIATILHGPSAAQPIPRIPGASSDSPHDPPAILATEHLAASYRLQAAFRLPEALDHARQATEQAPNLGLAWTRRAELAFSLGRIREARSHLDRALELSPDHPAAWTLRGFVHAADNRLPEALAAFERAIALDPGLADAWLGRGLVRIRQGDLQSGRTDLLIAAAREPQRSLPRSYLGKAFADSAPFRSPALPRLAQHELSLAQTLDPNDPTPWLYSALLHQQGNQINPAIQDLHESQNRHDQRGLFRSQLGLDQDRAVRSANLAQLYRDAGFPEIALREASHAIDDDYANAAAHLFLANSYDLRRDPRRIHLRYETPWYSEFLLANLLAPVGAGSLSQTIANHEYSRLFTRDRFGLVNATSWTGNGDWLQRSAQFGQQGNVAYSLDALYSSRVGQRLNNDSEELALGATVKIQAGPADDFLFQASYFNAESGDLLQRYDPNDALPGLRIEERHEPTAQIGWHHTWNPGHHTLALVSPWNVSLDYVNPDHRVPYTFEDNTGLGTWNQGVIPLDAYRSHLTGVAFELQQIWQSETHTVVAGARVQTGRFDTHAQLNPADFSDDIPAVSDTDPHLARLGFYAYDQWKPVEAITMTAGLSYDHLTQPINFRSAPVLEGDESRERLGPKLGVATRPWRGGTVRAGWSRSLGGVSLDQSQRLEPVQVAGFTQAYRGLFPESLTGSVSGQEMELIGVAWDQRISNHTWTTVSLERLTSEARQTAGGFRFDQAGYQGMTEFTDALEFTEDSLSISAGHALHRDVSLGVQYRIAAAELERSPQATYSNINGSSRERSIVQQLTGSVRYHHPSGFFASFDSTWTHQSNQLAASPYPGDDFWQMDAWVGWRFLRRQAEVAVGVLNLTDADYRLYPLNDLTEPYRDRTLAVSVRFAF
jgi:tetratricopeptide (TPR) repeat protein